MNRCSPTPVESAVSVWVDLVHAKQKGQQAVCTSLMKQLGGFSRRSEVSELIDHHSQGKGIGSKKLQEVGYLLYKDRFRELSKEYEMASEVDPLVTKMLRTVSEMYKLCDMLSNKGKEMEYQHLIRKEVLQYHYHNQLVKQIQSHCEKDVMNGSLQDRLSWKQEFWHQVDDHRVKVLGKNSPCRKKHCAKIIDFIMQKRDLLLGSVNHTLDGLQAIDRFLAACPEGVGDKEYVKNVTKLRLNFGEDVALFPNVPIEIVSRAYQGLKKAETHSAAKCIYMAYLILCKGYRGSIEPGKSVRLWSEKEAEEKANALYHRALKLLKEGQPRKEVATLQRELGKREALGYKTAANQDSRLIRLEVENMLLRLHKQPLEQPVVISDDERSEDEEPIRKKHRVEEVPFSSFQEEIQGDDEQSKDEEPIRKKHRVEEVPFSSFQEEIQGDDEQMANIPIRSWKERESTTSENLSREGVFDHQKQMQEDAKQEIGRWGEQAVYKRLHAHYKGKINTKYPSCQLVETDTGFQLKHSVNHSVPVEVIWYNKRKGPQEDWGGPYDFTIRKPTKERVLEVKTTASPSYRGIHLSGKEYEEMITRKERYSFFRVFHAGKKEAVIEKIKNPAKLFYGYMGCKLPGRILSLQLELP